MQSQDLGLDIPVTGAYSPLAAVVSGAAGAAIGRYSDFDCADYQSDEYQELARRYLAMSDNTFMEDDAVAGYGIVQSPRRSRRPVTTRGDRRVPPRQTFDLPGYPFEVSWTEWGSAAAQPLFSVIGDGPAPEGVNEAGDWYPETLILPEPLEPYAPDVAVDARARRRRALRRPPGRRGVTMQVERRRDRRSRRAQRRRQDDAAQDGHRIGETDSRPDPLHGHRRDTPVAAPHRRAGIAMALQNPRTFATMSVRENVMLGALFGSVDGRRTQADAIDQADEALGFVGLTSRGDDEIGALNLHEQRFVENSPAMAGHPRLLLLDEVMAGLNDTELQASIDIVRTARDRLGVTVIWVEHVMKAVMSLAERVVVLNFGAVLADGEPRAVMRDPEVVTAYLGTQGAGGVAGH